MIPLRVGQEESFIYLGRGLDRVSGIIPDILLSFENSLSLLSGEQGL